MHRLKLHREWIVKAEVAHRIRETGWLKAWRERCGRGGKGRAGAAEPNTASPANCSTVRLSPRSSLSIVPVYKVGLLHTQTASVDSPGAVVKAYARMFTRARAAMSRQSDVTAIVPDGDRWRVGAGRSARVFARHASRWSRWGPWSADIFAAARLSCARCAFERGYHREFKPNPATFAAASDL